MITQHGGFLCMQGISPDDITMKLLSLILTLHILDNLIDTNPPLIVPSLACLFDGWR